MSVALAAVLIAGATALGGLLLLVLRTLWQVRGRWDATLYELRALVVKVSELVTAKEADHARLERRDDEIAGRLERHLEWHDGAPAAPGTRRPRPRV